MDDKEQKKENKFIAFLKRVFVHNIGWKILAFASAALIWLLAAGLWSEKEPEEKQKPQEESSISCCVNLDLDDAYSKVIKL